MTTATVLHVCPPNGGGVDRFVRDITAARPQDWIVHAGVEQYVLEQPAGGRLLPVAPDALTDLARSAHLGRPAALHAHSAAGPVRHACEMLSPMLGVPVVLTLHDIGFAEGAEPLEQQQRLRFARAAARRTVPSDYIATLAAAALGSSHACARVENGVAPAAAQAAGRNDGASGAFPIAVVGALGPHKGLDALLRVSEALPEGMPVVLLGYSEARLTPGWLVPGRVWVHGPFEPSALQSLARSYGCRLVFFPSGQPESYCYALSDVWLAGLPVLAPDAGALGERVRRCGGGVLYARGASADDLARQLQALAGGTTAAPAPHAAAAQLVDVKEMVAAMNDIYTQVATPAPHAQADVAAVEQLAQKHLNGRFFRKELLRLEGDLSGMAQERDRARDELRALSAQYEGRGDWIRHLESDVAGLQDQLAQLHEGLGQLREEHRVLLARHTELQAHHEALQVRHQALKDKLMLPLKPLPQPVRQWLVKVARRLTR